MDNHDFTKLSKKSLHERFEQERREWLDAGMSEADIFRIHFGEFDAESNLLKPKDGSYRSDYQAWLAERKHTRSDHKYAPGSPVAIDTVDPDGAWISGGRGGIDETEFSIDFESALLTLTELQRYCFVSVEQQGMTQQAVADYCGITQQAVGKHINAARKKLKKYFQG